MCYNLCFVFFNEHECSNIEILATMHTLIVCACIIYKHGK